MKLLYFPYNFFRWCKKTQLIPSDSVLLCGIVPRDRQVSIDDGRIKFAVDLTKKPDAQLTAVFAGVATFRVLRATGGVTQHEVMAEVVDIVSKWEREWKSIKPEECDDSILSLDEDVVHPVIEGLKVFDAAGCLSADMAAAIMADLEGNNPGLVVEGLLVEDQIRSLKQKAEERGISNFSGDLQKRWEQRRKENAQEPVEFHCLREILFS